MSRQFPHAFEEALFRRINELTRRKNRVLIAIDGNSGAGKTNLANLLQSMYDCNVFSMDHFFLQPHQRTEARLAAPGGNVDIERFVEEVIRPLTIGMPFVYRVYDCRTFSLSETISADPRPLNVVEGVYSLHPHVPDVYDLKVFLKLDPPEQKRRISARDEALWERFEREWIPMENRYFAAFAVPESCDLLFDAASIPKFDHQRRVYA